MRRMLHAWLVQLLDEVAANFVLDHFLWYRRRPPVKGPGPQECPALYAGDLAGFYTPQPSAVDFDAQRTLFRETPTAKVWNFRFTSETTTRWPENNQVWCRHWQTRAFDRGLTVVGIDGIIQLGTTWFRRLATELNPSGIDVLTMDAPFNFRRTPAGYRPGQLIVGGDMAHQLAVTKARPFTRSVTGWLSACSARGGGWDWWGSVSGVGWRYSLRSWLRISHS